jgi:integrase/recombinase XerD
MRKLPVTISEAEFLEGLAKVRQKHHKLAFMLGFYQCMRVSEIIKLQPEDIDRERGFIHIKSGKGNKDRDIPIVEPVRKHLNSLPLKCRTTRALEIAIKNYWPELHFHSLRHSGATFYLNEKKVGLRQIQQMLGHSRLDTTQIYTHINPNDLKEAFKDAWR